jgi:hypothetical protein
MTKMSMLLMLLLGVVALSSSSSATAAVPCEESGGSMSMSMIKTQTFVSPPIFLGPGSVSNKVYSDMAFPRGHVAIKSFNGELVDEAGAPVPLHETYLHHWLVSPYYYAVAEDGGEDDVVVAATNSGICKDLLGQYFGLGAETRRTATWVPDPYGIEIGVPPAGYEERWSINVHAIDTRGATDALGCTECRCDLYNVTVDGYAGGFRCCPDGARCKVDGDGGKPPPPRKLFLRYTVTWLDWSDAVVPVRIYIFDVTDTALLDGRPKPECKVEYDVEQKCGGSSDGDERNGCVDVRVTKEMVPRGGDLVYGVGHLHRAGMGASLHGQVYKYSISRVIQTYMDISELKKLTNNSIIISLLGRAAALHVDADLRHGTRGRRRVGLRRRDVHVLPGARDGEGARRRGAHLRLQLQQRAEAHGGHEPLLYPPGRGGAGQEAAAVPLLQLPRLM